jgi:PA domain/RING-like zinc finger
LSAIISLTDDNSTFFLSRPAAFGPLLPEDGLSGQLWIGKGFGEDPLGRVGVDAIPEGELGCSDVPGWDEGLGSRMRTLTGENTGKQKAGKKENSITQKEYKDLPEDKSSPTDEDNNAEVKPQKTSADDGTDDYLHEPIVEVAGSVTGKGMKTSDDHADIQSLQETAEIGGKVVLLSRGGCGFLEKVKWAQKRGAIAVIVGDNIPGGPLLTMYAKGDTSNVTIAALFTSYTTAHLLSSLIPSGGHLGATLPPLDLPDSGTELKSDNDPKELAIDDIPDAASEKSDEETSKTEEVGWFKYILSCLGIGGGKSKSNTRPPSSGSNDWVVAQDWDEDQPKSTKKKGSPDKSVQNSDPPEPLDNFVIGVHDWRNPDLLKKPSQPKKSREEETKAKRSKPKGRELRGGPATPESGQYSESESLKDTKSTSKGLSKDKNPSNSHSGKGWLSSFTGKEKSEKNQKSGQKSASDRSNTKPSSPQKEQKAAETPHHEGLWVTLTPTTMSSSPFIDTLLVLVVSPLVTLTLVYALLLIRSRIRRRRWRAPKSVVDRLPIRTYHTIASGASTSSLATTPVPGTSGPNTPLLQSTVIPRPTGLSVRPHSRNRPRSFTTPEVLDQVGPSNGQQQAGDHSDAISLTESEKREKGLAEWRRRYGGRQRECVVCLEEYLDGVSQVMSLPCGHEFHAECM